MSFPESPDKKPNAYRGNATQTATIQTPSPFLLPLLGGEDKGEGETPLKLKKREGTAQNKT